MAGTGKTVRHDQTMAERHVMKSCQQIRFVEILYSLRWYVEFVFAEPYTILVFKIFYRVFGGRTRLAMPKTICVPDSSSLKPVQGLLRESWIRGSSDCRTIYFGRTVGLWRYNIKAWKFGPTKTFCIIWLLFGVGFLSVFLSSASWSQLLCPLYSTSLPSSSWPMTMPCE